MARPYLSGGDEAAHGATAHAWFRLRDEQGCAVVVASGEIDLYTSPELREALADAAQSSDRVILDLTDVTFLDSTGMGVMVGAMHHGNGRRAGSLCLVGPAAMVRRVLEITHLNDLFPIYGSLEEALKDLT